MCSVLFQLRDKPLNEHLQKYKPSEMAPEQLTLTLFDWVAIADVHRMQTEAFREMAAIKVAISTWMSCRSRA